VITFDIVEKAFTGLYPEQPYQFEATVKYSGQFKGYNANVRKLGNRVTFKLSKNWRKVSNEIKIGLIQDLLIRILKKKAHSINIDLYNIFLQKVHIAIPKTKTDPILEQSFIKLNDQYFYGTLEQPNLTWGQESYTKLGSYEYGTDTITISTALKQHQSEELPLLDFVVYHEMLHKKHKFKSTNGRTHAHTRAFKEDEKRFHLYHDCERAINRIRPTKPFSWLFG